MRKRIFILVCAMLLISSISSAELITWYKFDETSGTVAYDSSENNNNAILYSFDFNTNSNWDQNGKFGGALHFDGVNDVVRDDDLAIPTQAITYAFWFKPDVNLGPGSGRDDFLYGRGYSRPHLTFDRDGGDGKIGMYVSKSGSTGDIKSNQNQWNSSLWHHIVFTFDGSTYKMYINGDLESSYYYPGAHVYGEGYRIGAATDTGLQGFDGMMDDFAIWNNALTQTEVSDIYLNGIGNQAIPEPASIFLFAIFSIFICLIGLTQPR